MIRTTATLSRSLFLEVLEVRNLMSTVNITGFGAIANDGRDDSSAIGAAINASGNGDTVYFPAGTFDIATPVKLRGNRDYRGEADATTLKGASVWNHIFYIQEDNIRVEDLTFDGKPILLDKGSGRMVEKIAIDNNTFHVHARGSNYNGITFNTGLRNSSITNNTFDPIDGDNGVYGYYWDNLTIANNSFLNGNEGIHIIDHSNNSRNLLIEQNYFSGLHRMGIEYQGGGFNTIVQDNYYENPRMTGNFHDNDGTFAYSIIADESVGSIIRRNTSIAPQRPDGVGVRIVFEVGGDNTLVEQNYSVDGNHVLAANDGVGTTSTLVRNNRWGGYLQGPGGRGLTLVNNGPNVELNWNINRGKPGPGKRLDLNGYVDGSNVVSDPPDGDIDETPAPAPSPDQAPEPAPAPSPGGNGLTYLSDLAWTSATNGWGPVEINRTNGERDANDGGNIKLDGSTYRSGLGVAVNSEIVYDLDGKFGKFFSDIGVDDRSGNDGSVTFEVWADGKMIYDSGVITGADPRTRLSLKVAGVQELKLVTTNAGDGDRNDHADWAAPRLSPTQTESVL